MLQNISFDNILEIIKRLSVLIAVILLAVLTSSCSSGWSCKKRYVDNKQIVKHNNV